MINSSLIDRKLLVEKEIVKATDAAAKLYLACMQDQSLYSDYDAAREKLYSLKFDLSMIEALLKKD